MLVDTHAHLYWDSYKQDFDAVIKRALQRDVTLIIDIGTDLTTSNQAIETSRTLRLSGIEGYSSVGVHPHEGLETCSDESIHQYISDLEKLVNENSGQVVAIGECGLDYFREHSKDAQMKLFKSQVELAKKVNLPLVIHCRDAWLDIFIPDLQGTKGVFHNFSGNADAAQKALGLGYFLSFSCVLTYTKNEDLRQLLANIPLDRIVTETDCPFLPPQQIRGQRNEPSYIPEVIKVIAQVKKISEQEAAQQILQNTRALFNLPTKTV